MRHPLLLGGLGLTAAGLLLGLLLVPAGRGGRVDPRNGLLFPNFTAGALERLTFTVEGKRHVWVRASADDPEVYRTETGVRLDPARVGGLLRAITDARFERMADVEGAPERTLALTMANGAASVEVYGSAPDVARGRFLCVRAEATARCGVALGALVDGLLAAPTSYVDVRLLPFRPSEVTGLERVSPEPLRLVADPLGFRIEDGARVSAATTRRFLNALAEARLVEANPTATSRGGIDRPSVELRIARAAETWTLTLADGCDGGAEATRVLFASGDAFCASGALFERARTLGAEVETRLCPLAADELDHFRLEGPEGTLEVLREGAGFRALGESSLELDRTVANELFEELAKLEGAPTSPPTGLVPSSRWTLFGVAPRTNEEVRVELEAALVGEFLLVRRVEDDRWFRVPPTPLLLGSARVLQSLVVHSLPGTNLESLLRRTPSGAAIPLDLGLARFEGVARRFSELRALRWKAGTPANPPRFSLEGRFSGDSEPVRLSFHETVLGGVVTTSSRHDGTFVLARETVDLLDVDDWSGRRLLSKDVPEMLLELRSGGRELLLLRDGETWRTKPERALTDPEEVALAVLDLTARRRASASSPRVSGAPVLTLELRSPRTPDVERVVIERCVVAPEEVCLARIEEELVEISAEALARLLRLL